MQLLSLSCVICISGEPRRHTQRASERGERESERESIELGWGERKREREGGRERQRRGRKHAVIGEPI